MPSEGSYNYDEHLTKVEDRVGRLENRVGGLENRVGVLENRVGSLEVTVKEGFARVDERFDNLTSILEKLVSEVSGMRKSMRAHIAACDRSDRSIPPVEQDGEESNLTSEVGRSRTVAMLIPGATAGTRTTSVQFQTEPTTTSVSFHTLPTSASGPGSSAGAGEDGAAQA
jgi:hypothetical protein